MTDMKMKKKKRMTVGKEKRKNWLLEKRRKISVCRKIKIKKWKFRKKIQ